MTFTQHPTSLPLSIVEHIRHVWPGVQLVYLFGSRAKNSSRGDSDWDIAVLASGTLENTERWELAQALAVQLKQDVDLVDLRLSADICERMKKWWD